MDEIDEISSIITIKNRLSNQMAGSFKLYRPMTDDIEAEFIVKKSTGDDLRSIIEVRVEKYADVNATMDIMYRGNSDAEGEIEAIAANYIDGLIEVRPHNRMFGKFELMGAPKVSVTLPPIADATTRSREDLRTINYGDTRSMLTGKTIDEEFGAFVQFADFVESIPDLKFIESAKLRLYYTNVHSEANIELHQPNTIWRELGITDANKPQSVEKLSDTFTINTVQRYVEFDVKDIAKRWQDGTLDNYGFIISTSDDVRYTLFTRESDYPPQLIVDYITSQVFSIGRSELECGIFVYGKGDSDLSARLTVDSDVGINNMESYLYVHRSADFMHSDVVSNMPISKPDLFSRMTVQRREFTDLESVITVGVRSMTEIDSSIGISIPDIDSWLTVDPNMSLASIINVPAHEYLDSYIAVSQPDLNATLTVSDHTRVNSYMDSVLTVRTEYESIIDSTIDVSVRDLAGLISIRGIAETEMDGILQVPDRYDVDSTLGYSHPDMNATLTIRAIGDSGLDGLIEVPYYEDMDSTFGYSRPDLNAMLTVTYTSEVESEIYVKDKEYLNSMIDVKNISEMSGVLMIKAVNQIDGEMTVNNPELFGYLIPRVTGDSDLVGQMLIKKRNVADLNSYISVRGKGNRNFVIMF
ncbi:DNRLRE domain-containing protein [Paenibacillus donghaensis]|uniref:Carbohydrate-binding module family 96 domain-containing protein n=1 Tax=Paenibacillus donghaensis TaxID=414771 RepID=A0A2Z2KKA1_9BACL|nr:DNRLRE domain-containing protein [Paenibacillus donghaensis]ASA22789.1 hypothetical protein B9T62_19470 [Paenibacillus donghaensis]